MSEYSSLFTLPPKDHKYTIDQLYQWHSVHSSKAPTFIYPDADRNNELVEITWNRLEKAILAGVQVIRDRIPECSNGDPNSKPFIVGILATTNTITYTAMLYAHLRLSHSTTGRPLVPFLISPRNSPTVVQHIVQESGALYLWTSEGPMKAIADEAVNSMPEGKRPIILSMPSFDDLYSENIATLVPTSPELDNVVVDRPALILHSSGSTAFPKLRTLTHRMLREWCMTFGKGFFPKSKKMRNDDFLEWSDFDMYGQNLGAHAPAIFHAMGVFVSSWAAASGLIRSVQYPKATFTPLTAESYLEQVIMAKCNIVYCVPSYIEEWAKNPETFPVLNKLKGVFWGGAPLSVEAERTLYNAGVPLLMVFGLTEFGMPVNFPAKRYPEGGDYFKFSIQVEPILVPQEGEADVYEVVMKDAPLFHITNFTSEIDRVPVYETNDLVQPHPTNKKLYKVIGRKDDQLMLSTGEKTNPGPLETIIQRDSHVQAALYFGRGRISNGVLIQPKSHDEVEKLGIEGFRNLIWPSIQKANEYAPAHSRVFKEMILISSAEKPFAYTAKNTPRRGIILKAYDKEIDELYKLVEQSSNVDMPVPSGTYPEGGWTAEEGLEFVRKVVYKVLGEIPTISGMTDEDDIFTFNCDSLQATMIKNTLLHALRQVTPVAIVQALPGNFVYQHPTVRSLAGFATTISQARVNATDTSTPEIGDRDRHQRMDDLIKRYTQQWPVHTPKADTVVREEGDIVLLTGSTGGLGSQLLARLLVSRQVSRVYAFNRPNSQKSSYERHVEVFSDRGNDVKLLESKKIVFVEGDTSVDGFGIDTELFNEIRNSVTTIILNAWRVDFNISLSSFEPAIRGVRKLIDFALGSPHLKPPQILFTSSIGIVKTWLNIPAIKEEPITDLGVINTNGYSESKWVCERILTIAEQETALKPVIIRVGQLSGGLNGHWNVKEWFSGLVRASQIIGAAPENDGIVSFVPIHIAASAILELRHTPIMFAHLVHPQPSPWKDLIGHVTEVLHVPTIPYAEWLKRLESLPRTEETLKANPSLHLIDFYKGCIAPSGVEDKESRDAIGLATYETTQTVLACVSLGPQYLLPLSKEEVERWVGYWRVKGALN